MERTQKIKQKAQELINQNQKPTAQQIAEEISWPPQDVHRCLNILEKQGQIQTYTKEPFDQKIRFISIKR